MIKLIYFYYLFNFYQYILTPEESGGFYIKFKELPGCGAYGETVEEAYKNIKESMKIWFNDVINQNLEIPLPEDFKNYSGKFLLRIPRSLHKELVEKAKDEGVSLNQYILSILTKNKETSPVKVMVKKAISKKSIKKKKPEV